MAEQAPANPDAHDPAQRVQGPQPASRIPRSTPSTAPLLFMSLAHGDQSVRARSPLRQQVTKVDAVHEAVTIDVANAPEVGSLDAEESGIQLRRSRHLDDGCGGRGDHRCESVGTNGGSTAWKAGR